MAYDILTRYTFSLPCRVRQKTAEEALCCPTVHAALDRDFRGLRVSSWEVKDVGNMHFWSVRAQKGT